MSRIPLALSLLATTLALGACVKSPSAPADPNAIRPAVLRIVPASTTTGVDPTKPVTITFNYPMMTGMGMLVVLHFSPSLQGANGQMIDVAACTTIGGQYVSGGMMGSAASGMMNGQWGPGMMGVGWQASDGTFGMFFAFTTA